MPAEPASLPGPGAAFADVVIDGLNLAEQRPYTYRVPEAWRGKLTPGTPVLAPFGAQGPVAGYVVALRDVAPEGLEVRELADVVEGEVLPPTLQALLPWLAETTLASMADIVTTVMPRGTLSRIRRTVVRAVSEAEFAAGTAGARGAEAVLAEALARHGGAAPLAALRSAARRSSPVLAAWRQRGWIRTQATYEPPRQRERRVLHACLAPEARADDVTPRQAEVLEVLRRSGGVVPAAALQREAATTPETLRRLAARGLLTLESRPVRRSAVGHASADPPPPLTPRQREVVEAIVDAPPGARTYVLHGVTGSGKTEVYMQVIAQALDAGRTAIVLVPEIALTPQTVRRFQGRFGDTVAVLHSHLSEGERFDEWQRIRGGDARVVVGARSAVFAPLDDLGVIIVDEEHESSYKQDTAPRYHARTVAAERARLAGAILVLGSATPSVESYAAALDGAATLLEMPERVEDRPLPPVTVVDMRKELADGNRSIFSRALRTGLGEILAAGEQAILLLNRRGYSSHVFCRECGHTCKCARCSVALTHHANPPGLRCHYCDHREPLPETCPSCHGATIRHFGAGTQQVEEACQRLFPEARIVRVDRDTTQRRGSHAALLDAFGRGEQDILIGTQMVAKGLDFPRVTLVGVMAADAALNLPDFRAAERTFQLLSQVAGRAGRHTLPGRVVVQAYEPGHVAVQAAAAHDYRQFYEAERPDRQALMWPPDCALVVMVAAAAEEALAARAAGRFAEALRGEAAVEVFGPHEAPLARVRGLARQQVVVKTQALDALRPLLRRAAAQAGSAGVRIALDLNPYHML
ncbi:MAG: primosomal protein N' [Candidatus Sericytochromatia bacterium]|nr:primosomal protein N' [Candidatus Sericytochromatia bacterium]